LRGDFQPIHFLMEWLRLGAWRVLGRRGPAWRSGLANTLHFFWALLAPVALEADVVGAYVGIPRSVGCSRWAWRACRVQREQAGYSPAE
jgi:hypothetical protein